MEFTPLFYSLNIKQGCWARVWLNDLPLSKGIYIGPETASSVINHFLVPGENEVAVELLKVRPPDNANMDVARVKQDQFELLFYKIRNLGAPESEPILRNDICHVRYPNFMEGAPQEHQRIPFYFQGKFKPEVEVASPVFESAPEDSFGCDGTPELQQAVTRVFDLLENRDWDGFLDELELKFTHAQGVYPGEVKHTYAYKRKLFHEEMFPYVPVPERLSMADLHFQPLRGGRVAYVTKKDGGYAMNARCEKDPKTFIRTDFLFVKHQDRWRVFA